MIQNGETDIINTISEKQFSTVELAASVTYDRIAARDYANKWTSENPPGGQDATKYNPDYNYYANDCANYVSQALHAGGIPTDTTWKPKSTAWINTGHSISNGLIDYMVDTKGYFKKSTKSSTAAGGIINALDYSHVMMVVANDGVTMQYSAHTTDRLKHSFAGFSSTEYEYYVYNP
ncbi:putative amidase domain protein [compost metagenome]